MKTKLREWKIIADEYNGHTAHCTRSAENLRAQWESMKKVARKEAANSRKNLGQAVDESPKTTKKDENLQHRIFSLLSSGSGGLFNPYDSDSSATTIQDQSITDIQTEEYNPIPEPEILIKMEGISDEEWDHQESVAKVCENYMPQQQQALKVGNAEKKHTPIQTPSHRTWVTRRRQPSSSEQLYKKKIEAIKYLQNKLALEEAERLKDRHDLDVKIKQEMLRQEKIKTHLLLVRRRKLLGLRKRQNHLLSVHNQNGNEAL